MTISLLRLEDFDNRESDHCPVTKTVSDWEAERSVAFADGFESGRAFAIRDRDQGEAKTRREIARSLQDLEFTHLEARRHVLKSLKPLVRQIATVLAPALAEAGLADLIAAEVDSLAERFVGETPRIHVAEGMAQPLEEALHARGRTLPGIVEDPALDSYEARISASGAERHLDPAEACDRIATAIKDFLNSNLEERANG